MCNSQVTRAVPKEDSTELLDKLERTKEFKQFSRAMEQAIFSQQAGGIEELIKDIKSRYHELLVPEGIKKALPSDETFDERLDRIAEMLDDKGITNHLKGMVAGVVSYASLRLLYPDMFEYMLWASNEAGKQELLIIGVPTSQATFLLADDDILELLRIRVDGLIQGLTETSRNNLYADLVTGLKQGMTEQQLRSHLISRGTITSQSRAAMISRTELANAHGLIRQEAALRNGAIMKSWKEGGERTCPICLGNAGEGKIPIDQSFGDGSFATPAHVNCMCSIDYDYPFQPGEYDPKALWFGENQ